MLYGDDWDESLEPKKPSNKRFQFSASSGTSLMGLAFVKSKTILGDPSLLQEDREQKPNEAKVVFAKPLNDKPKKKVTFAEPN